MYFLVFRRTYFRCDYNANTQHLGWIDGAFRYCLADGTFWIFRSLLFLKAHAVPLKEKNCKPVSRILYSFGAAIIYLGCALLHTSICLPWIIGRAALNRSYTWHFSTQGLPAIAVTTNCRRLLPYVFTLTRRQLFSVALSRSFCKEVPPLAGYVALCCPDFPYSGY